MDSFQHDTSKVSVKEMAFHFINISHGIKDIDILLKLMGTYGPSAIDKTEFLKALHELVVEHRVCEIQYLCPKEMEIRKVYFEGGTRFGPATNGHPLHINSPKGC